MAQGLVSRFLNAGIPQPQLLYVDRDCCGQFNVRASDLFPQWEGLAVRLDVWHFMRRLAACVTSESHSLYGMFMSKLSACIFRWDEEDVNALRQAKVKEQCRWAQVSPMTVELTAKVRENLIFKDQSVMSTSVIECSHFNALSIDKCIAFFVYSQKLHQIVHYIFVYVCVCTGTSHPLQA